MSQAMSANWNYPTDIRFGCGRIDEALSCAQQLNMHKPLLVTDTGLMNCDFIETIRQQFKHCHIFSQIKANPTGANVSAGVEYFQQQQCDGVIAVGGGSALDSGKAIALMVGQVRPLWDFEDSAANNNGNNWQRVKPEGIAPLIAIPTTAGTGSEVGRAAVIVDEASLSKKIIFHPDMMPNCVIADPQLCVGLPAGITAATGLDAFVHNFEAFCAPGYHPMADGIALQGMQLIKDNLLLAYTQPDNLEARSNMLVASTMGATAFQKGLGAVHALAHPLGAVFDKHHGLLNAILLPYVMIKNRSAIESKAIQLSRQLQLPQTDFNGLLDWVIDFRQQLGIASCLADIGIDSSRADDIAERAHRDPSAAGNPIELSVEDYRQVFVAAVDGQLA